MVKSFIFDCDNDVSLQEFRAFLQNSPKTWQEPTSVNINGQDFENFFPLEDVELLTRIIRKNWCYIESTVLYNETVPISSLQDSRKEINVCFQLLILHLKDAGDKQEYYLKKIQESMRIFEGLLLPITEFADDVHRQLNKRGLNNILPIYYYFHTLQDIQYHLLLLNYEDRNEATFRGTLQRILNDLVAVSQRKYGPHTDSAFICTCHRNLTTIMIHLSEKFKAPDYFWGIFNEILNNEPPEFTLWLLKDVATLPILNSAQAPTPNLPLLELAIKKTLSTSPPDILLVLKWTQPLLCNVWIKASKIEIFQQFWEFFGRRLNGVDRSNVGSVSAMNELLEAVLSGPSDCTNDFDLFLSMLNIHLQEHPFHWGKLKGRIYSQLGPNKIKDLNHSGVFNVLLLFLVLHRVNVEELSRKFLGLIAALPPDKRQSSTVWICYGALISLHISENRDIEPITPQLIKMLEEASTEHKHINLLQDFVKAFPDIIKINGSLQLHQNLLLNTWIHKYMSNSYYPDLLALLKLLTELLTKIIRDEIWMSWERTFRDFIYPPLEILAISPTAPELCGSLAAQIVAITPNLLPKSFNFFTGEGISVKVSSTYLSVILQNMNPAFLTQQQQLLALRIWAKYCFLTRGPYTQVTEKITTLGLVPEFLKPEMGSPDPLFKIVTVLSLDLNTYRQSSDVARFCEVVFGCEEAIARYLTNAENDTIVLRIFTCIGLAFHKIGPLLYSKSRSNCPFERLLSAVFLTSEVLAGRNLNRSILHSIQKTWHLFFAAAVKLNNDDPYIERILGELIMKFLPYFSTGDSPMIKCLENEVLTEIILEKISTLCLKHPSKETESNVLKSLRLIMEFVQSCTNLELTRLVIKRSLQGVFEVVMFHNQATTAVSLIKCIIACPLFLQLQDDFYAVVVAVTEAHLVFNASSYFQLMEILAKCKGVELGEVMPKVRQQISNVERLRGVGYDKNLRLQLGRLEAVIAQTKS